MAATGPAHAGRGGGIVIINVGDDIMHVRDTDPQPVLGEDGTETQVGQIGYHYERFGLFWLDFWRWSGEYVLYSGDSYAPLTDAEVEQLGGAKFPIAYHLPPGLLGLLAGGYYLIVLRRPRTVRFALIAGGVLILLAVILFVLGLGAGVLIPGLLGVYHLAAAKFGTPATDADSEINVDEDDAEPERPMPRAVPRPSAPRFETDPFRAPPQQAPIHVERPSAPLVAPVAVDPNAEAPKMLI